MATILIVDDHPPVRVVLKTHLSQVLGVTHVLEADNGQAAIEIVRQFAPDVVILDLDIPKINGLEVIPRLKAIHPGVRILVISGQDQNTFAPRAPGGGARLRQQDPGTGGNRALRRVGAGRLYRDARTRTRQI